MAIAEASRQIDLDALSAIERRVLWLAVRIVDYANRERPRGDELKVGGHQASSASMVTLLTALYVADLDARDRVSVKPHASPVLHALEYLLGRLDGSYLTRLRDFGGLQSYPSRTKDPFPVDFSTGSVGLGSAAPVFAALADRYVQTHFGSTTGGRFISLLGDAELDEGNLWEALSEPLTRQLGNVLWIVDLNRQSLDRVVPGIKAHELEQQFRTVGWQVLELKYGRRLREAYAREGGDLLRRRIDEMPNEQYQSLFGASEDVVRATLLEPLAGEERVRLDGLLEDYRGRLLSLVGDLGGHDLADVLDSLRQAREAADRPTVIFAYTIKGYGLEIAGRPQNHSALLAGEQIDRFRAEVGVTPESEWDRFGPETPEGAMLARAAARLDRGERPLPAAIPVPARLADRDPPRISTQAAFGRTLLDLSRVEGLQERLVTVSPDVSVSTNLGGFINKAGVWGPEDEPVYDAMEDSPLRWRVGRSGQHIEMGIAEMNLVLALGQLGLTWDFQRERLFPVGTLYDPFVMRALEGIVYSVYSGARFVLCGTPSGISLSREGGAHQSLNTPGIGLETPGLTYCEPAYARELEWLLLDALARMQQPDGEALYVRLSTKPIDQAPFADAVARRGEESLRADVVAGGFRLREPVDAGAEDRVLVATCGALVPEALAAADQLQADEGVHATVLCLSSPDRLYHDWQRARTRPLRDGGAATASHLDTLLLEGERGLPVVSVIDGASHALAWLGSALGTRCVPLGVDRFGQTGSQPELYAEYGIGSEAITTAALAALEP
ncbi:MAG TPA: 1-deoxy-D-xylulose-5-phosphate synthase N-terminal domain-containing protein [Gaiellaceae bacterium]|nr:1-deoxy-D-xylulose-5-phosphate synthase N-terminal domain-containing protein [Gaiellaceae bacterium]